MCLEDKEEIIIFGSGEAAKAFIEKNTVYKIKFIVDNNLEKQNKYLKVYKIYAPKEMLLYNLKVLIASSFVNEIKEQLITEYNMDEKKIIIPTKQLLKRSGFAFQVNRTKRFANKVLVELINKFNKIDLLYFVDYGTLLGIVREGDLLSWDEDIDFKILNTDSNKFRGILNEYADLNGYLFEKDILRLTISKEGFKDFYIDFEEIYLKNNNYISKRCIFPNYFFEKNEEIEYCGENIKVPSNHQEYLRYVYGDDWNIPKQNFTFEDYKLVWR